MKRALQFLVSLALGGLFLWLSFRGVALRDALDQLLAVPWYYFALYVGSLAVTHTLRAERYRLQLRRMTGQPVPFWEAYAQFTVGMAATFFIPFRLGEFVRPYLCKARGYLTVSAGLSTVAAERVIDGLTTTAMLGVVLLLMRGMDIPAVVYVGGYAAIVVFGGAFLVFVAGYLRREWSVSLFRRIVGVVSRGLAQKLGDVLDRFLAGLNTLPSWRDLLLYEAYTLTYWLLNGAGMYLIMRAMHMEVGWVGGYFVLGCLVIGVMIPAPPGNVGNFEYAVVLPLTTLGVAGATAGAYAIAIHLLQALQMTFFAMIFVASGHVTLRRVVEATQQHGDDAVAAG